MDIVHTFIDFFLHLDKHLDSIILQFGAGSYLLLFLIIFLETGAVFAPFLPGDSLLFVAGTLAGHGSLAIIPLYVVLALAAILGDTVNYWVGHFLGPKVFARENSRFFKREYLDKTAHFFEKYGAKAIILGRFMPILRTFAPFIAGIGRMHYPQFLYYNVIGGLAWVTLFTFAGYFFGGLSVVKSNFHYAILFIIVASLIPGVLEYMKYHKEKKLAKEEKVSYQELERTFKKQHISD